MTTPEENERLTRTGPGIVVMAALLDQDVDAKAHCAWIVRTPLQAYRFHRV